MEDKNRDKIIYERLFPKPPGGKYEGLMIDRESISYITTPTAAQLIANIIAEYAKHCKFDIHSVTDCTGCVGGDTIAFAKRFDHVESIEIDSKRFAMLKNNVESYGLDNVDLINDDCSNHIKSSNATDVVYMDPPWGGKNYKKNKTMRLTIGNLTIEEFSHSVMNGKMFAQGCPKMLALKLPQNYDYGYFCRKVNKRKNMRIIRYRLTKIDLLIIIKNQPYSSSTSPERFPTSRVAASSETISGTSVDEDVSGVGSGSGLSVASAV